MRAPTWVQTGIGTGTGSGDMGQLNLALFFSVFNSVASQGAAAAAAATVCCCCCRRRHGQVLSIMQTHLAKTSGRIEGCKGGQRERGS